jgi:DNA-binding NarL/FixJ family response regulator
MGVKMEKGEAMRVVVADDSMLLREGLVRLLTEAACEVVASVADLDGFIAAVDEHQPDVAVVDVRMPPTMTDDGLRAAVEARRRRSELGVLVLSAYIERSYADVLLCDGRGRVGYVLKDRVASLDVLVDAPHHHSRREVLQLGGRRQLSVLLAENLLPAAADQGQHRH